MLLGSRRAAPSGVQVHHHGLGSRNFDMRVYLGGSEVGMPQERLNEAQVGSVCEQVRSEGHAA